MIIVIFVIVCLLYYFFIINRFFQSYFNKTIVVKSKYIDSNTYYILSDQKYKLMFPWFKLNGNKQLLYNNFKIGNSYNVNGYGTNIYSIIY